MGKFFFAFLLVILLVVEDANGGWGRKLWRKTKKHLKKVGEIAQTVATVKTVAGVIGKRSTEGEQSKIDLCYFESMDLDGDKMVTEDEVQVIKEMTGVQEINGLFEILDQDGDGKISIEDYRDVISYCTEEKIIELNKKLSI